MWIVATEQIQGIADLEGKTIALSSPGISVFYLNVLLADVGLTTAQVEIMARHVGGWLEDPAAFVEALEGVRLYYGERNRAYFGTPQDPGPIYGNAQKAIDVWTSLCVLEADIAPQDIVGHRIWD
jgi:hypothetical protein